MTRLPEPMPYSYVDEWIDSRIVFSKDSYIEDGCRVQVCSARPKSGTIGNFVRALYSLLDDYFAYQDMAEDEDGYIEWFGGYPQLYSKPMTEEELDEYIKFGI